MEGAYTYQHAGDFAQAERYHRQAGNLLALFIFYAEQGQPAKAQEVFGTLAGFGLRYRATTQIIYKGWDSGKGHKAGMHLAISCAQSMLEVEANPHNRAALYRILAEANARLWQREALLESARKAVELNPKSPWGWYWLTEAYSQGEWYASEAAVLKHELTFFTGQKETDRRSRGQIFERLGHLYRLAFHHPEIAIECYRKEIEEYAGLPEGAYRCSGAYMNICRALMEDLHDSVAAKRALEEARRIDHPLFRQVLRDELQELGLDRGVQ